MRVPPEPAWSGAPPVSWILRESRMPALLAGQTGQIRQRANWFWPRNRGTLSDSHNIQLTGPAPPHVGPVGTLMYGWKCAPATKEKCGLAHVAAGAATALSCPGINRVGLLEASPSGRPCRSYGARLLRAGASEGPASPGLAGGALLSRDGVARRLRESAQLLRTCSATLPRPVAGNGVQGGGLRALW